MRLPRWTDADLRALREMVAGGKTDPEIAAELNRRAGRQERTCHGVRLKRHKVGLCKRRPASGPKVRPEPKGGQRGALLTGAAIEGAPADERARNRARQLARDLGEAGEASVYRLTRGGDGYTEGYLRALLDEGARWFERTPFGIRLTDAGRKELTGGRAA